MSLPKIIDKLRGYVYEWAEEQVVIEVTRLRHHQDGHISGFITVSTTAPGASPHLHQAQFNFSSSQTRKSLTKILSDRYPEPDWGALLEQLCVYTTERFERGEPVTEVWIDDAEIVPLEYLAAPYILKGVPTILFGEKGVSKSTLALYIYVCLLLPWDENPIGLAVPERGVKTLILDWEQEKPIVEYYARRLRLGNDLPPFPLYHLHCARRLTDDITKIQEAIVDFKAECIVIDSLGAACGGELGKPEPALDFFAGLRQLRTHTGEAVTSIILGQTSKDQETKKKSIFGSTYFTYYARSILEVCKAETSTGDEVDVALFHRWYNYGKLQPPLGFRIIYENNHAIRFESRSVNMFDFLEKMTGNQAILTTLEDENRSLSTKELIELTGIKEGSIRQQLKRLKDKGIIIKVGDNWGRMSHHEG